MSKYDHKSTENKWQRKWKEEKVYYPSDMLSVSRKNKYYNLWMFPYPSAEGLHAGHAFSSTGSDVFGRHMRMKGYEVLQPIGYDSFGIHSENFALKIGEHPQKMLERTTKNYEKQMRSLGHGYDWTRTVTTSEPNYYRWTQWLFVQMFKAGLAYRKKSSVNWCPSCKTVLADEQVIAGGCERCQSKVETKMLEQWFFRITDYADRLLENLEKIDWPEKIKTAQRNWIGKSQGATVKFEIRSTKFEARNSKHYIDVFTTRPDTLYGATFFVLSPENPIVNKVTTSKYKKRVQMYIKKAKAKSKEDRMADKGEKTGVFTGGYVKNPATGKKIPVFVSDYVLMDYGTGAVMGVPAHDQRDWDFAKKNSLEMVEVISGGNVEKQAYDGSGKIINSGRWNGLKMPDELEKVIKDLEKQGWGRSAKTYHLRDWLISRQRYWGPPIPMIFCGKCANEGKSWYETNSAKDWLEQSKFKSKFKKEITGNWKLGIGDSADWSAAGWYPVDEKDLPVELPNLKDYKPKGTGRGPLADHPKFYETKCPSCKGKAKRETDVSDTFLDSSWYFLRYPSVRAGEQESKRAEVKKQLEVPWDTEITQRWLPVDLYFGGAEHAVLHLMYARFVTQALNDLGYLNFDEPFPKFFAHGLMIKNGAKMSKSRGNVVNPDEYIEKFGADTLRLYLMFMGPMDGYPDFRDTGIEGMRRFVEKVWTLFHHPPSTMNHPQLTIKMHQTIKKVTSDIEEFKFNTAIASIMEYVNVLREVIQGSSRAKSRDLVNEQVLSRSKVGRSLGIAASPGQVVSDILRGPRSDKNTNHQSPTTPAPIGVAQTNHLRKALKTLALLLAPFAPHLAEQVWVDVLGQKFSIHRSSWPKYDAKYIKEDQVTIIVQVNGKLRSTFTVDRLQSTDKEKVIGMAKQDEKIKKWIDRKKVKKEIFVPGKLVNFVF